MTDIPVDYEEKIGCSHYRFYAQAQPQISFKIVRLQYGSDQQAHFTINGKNLYRRLVILTD